MYVEVKNPLKSKWLRCPNCKLIPCIWEFDNGRSTVCKCKNFSIKAECVKSVIYNSYNGTSVEKYNIDELRQNWNHWVKTREELFKYKKYYNGFATIVKW